MNKPITNKGFKPDPAQQAWLFEQTAKEKERAADPNPCGRVYFKCAIRGSTHGPGTDHRAGWNACTKFLTAPQRERKTAGR